MSDIVIASTGSRQLAVASQWQLMWWAFRRHRLAMIGLAVTILLYMIAAVPGFFATNDPYQQNGRAAYHPPQAIHLIDTDASGGWTFRPYFHPARLARDPVSLAAVYKPDTEPQDRDPLLRRRLRVFGLRPVHLQAASARLRRSAPAAVPRRRGPARPLRLEPHHAGRADLALARPRRRDPVVAHRGRDRRHLGLLRRPHRLRDPARDRVRARDPEHPDLARAFGRDAARLAGDHAVFHDHRDPVAHRLGAARPRGARPLPLAAHRGVRHRGAARRLRAKGGSSSATCCRAS